MRERGKCCVSYSVLCTVVQAPAHYLSFVMFIVYCIITVHCTYTVQVHSTSTLYFLLILLHRLSSLYILLTHTHTRAFHYSCFSYRILLARALHPDFSRIIQLRCTSRIRLSSSNQHNILAKSLCDSTQRTT